MSHTWLWLKQSWFYLTTTEKDKKDDKIKSSLLITRIDQNVKEIFKTLTFDSADDEMRLEPFLNNFVAYCNPRKIVTILHDKFFI